MPSSTSSSEPTSPRALAALFARAFAPPAAVTALLLVAAALWHRARPAPIAGEMEAGILEAQMQRARDLPRIGVLIIGDSSALMDVDATALGAALGRPAESLGTIGYVGPQGFVRLAETYAAAGHRIPTLVFLIHGTSLQVSEPMFQSKGLEALVLGTLPARRSRLGAARQQIADGLILRAVQYPLPGSFGRHYGWPEDLIAALHRGHGTLVDPNRFEQPTGKEKPYAFAIAAPVRVRLQAAAGALARLAPERVVVSITPIPARLVGPDTLEQRAAAARELLEDLRLPASAWVSLAPTMPDDDFASITHLNAVGRARYTDRLAAALRAGAVP